MSQARQRYALAWPERERMSGRTSVAGNSARLRALRVLSDRVETEVHNREMLHPRKAMCAYRQNHCFHSAGRLMMDALALGGPQDEKLRLVLLSRRDTQTARDDCFIHVCDVWPPLRDARVVTSAADLLACARALRVIAEGVWRGQDREDARTVESPATRERTGDNNCEFTLGDPVPGGGCLASRRWVSIE